MSRQNGEAFDSEIGGGSSFPFSFPSQPPDIRNWFSSYEYAPPPESSDFFPTQSEREYPLGEAKQSSIQYGDDDGGRNWLLETQLGTHSNGIGKELDVQFVPETECSQTLPQHADDEDHRNTLLLETERRYDGDGGGLAKQSGGLDVDEKSDESCLVGGADKVTESSVQFVPETECSQTLPQHADDEDHRNVLLLETERRCDGDGGGLTKQSDGLDVDEKSDESCLVGGADKVTESSVQFVPETECSQTLPQHADDEDHRNILLLETERRCDGGGGQRDGLDVGEKLDQSCQVGGADKVTEFYKDGFICTKKKRKNCSKSFNSSSISSRPPMENNDGFMLGEERQLGRVAGGALADRTNIQEAAQPEAIGKWQCPRKSKPYVGPPLKQLRLERWVRRLG